MKLPVSVVVEARDRSLLLRLGIANGPLVRVPRSAVCHGEYFHGGERDVLMDFATWIHVEIMAAIARARTRPGRVLDMQRELWQERP